MELQQITKKHTNKLLGFYKHMILVITWCLSLTSHAIIIRHDTPDQHYQDLAKHYSASVAYLDRCVATVLSKNWLITAKHCVSIEHNYPLSVSHIGIKYPVEEIVVPPHLNEDDHDIALLKLKWSLEGSKPVAIYDKKNENGKQVIFVGKGFTGNGLTGDKTRDKIERAATNTVNKVEKNWLEFTFNKPETATELEGVSGKEDSGGPAFIMTDEGLKLAGVGCCQLPVIDNNEELQGGYLSTEYYTRLSSHHHWIDQQISKSVPEKAIDSPILQALSYNKIETAKRLIQQDKQWLKKPELISEILIYSFFRSNELSHFLLTTFPTLHKHKISDMPLTVYAYKQGNSAIFSLLIKLGVAMDYSGFKGQQLPSLITWQYFNDDYPQLIQLLIKRGFNINRPDNRGDIALHMAVFFGWSERVKALLQLGANINQADNKGNTALIDAAKSGQKAIVQLLVNQGANIHLANHEKKTAAKIAQESGFLALANYLNKKA